jgi:hypothetical protein
MKRLTFAFLAIMLLPVTSAIAEETPRQQAERVQRESMAKALAEKARNDRIVEAQRAAERAARAKATPTATPKKK